MCTHKVDIPLNAIVEVVLVDEVQQPNLSHPFHLHGYGFNVIGNYARLENKADTRNIGKMFIELIFFSFSRSFSKVSVDRPIRQSRKSIWSMPSIWIVAVYCIVNMIYRPWKIRSQCQIMATLCSDLELIIQGELGCFTRDSRCLLCLMFDQRKKLTSWPFEATWSCLENLRTSRRGIIWKSLHVWR